MNAYYFYDKQSGDIKNTVREGTQFIEDEFLIKETLCVQFCILA